jgi:hypothetical protein
MEKFVPSKPIIKFPTVEFRLIRGLLLDLCPVYAVAQTSDEYGSFLNYEQLLRPAITNSPEIVHGSPSNLISTSCSQRLSGSNSPESEYWPEPHRSNPLFFGIQWGSASTD